MSKDERGGQLPVPRSPDAVVPEVSSVGGIKVTIGRIAPPDVPGETLRAVLGEVPYLGVLTTWYEQGRNRETMARVREVLHNLDDRIGEMERGGAPASLDESWAELVANILPIIARTRSEEKRGRFVALLAEAGRRERSDQHNQVQSLAILLDQLEDADVVLLDRVVRASSIADLDDRLGHVRYAELPKVGYEPSTEAHSWVRLHRLGLLSGGDNSAGGVGIEFDGKHEVAVIVTPIGLALHEWITGRPNGRPLTGS